ncbi:MAG: ABC transporter permease subunit [Methanobacteriota archaeon]|nr:MAG: ABC transporter permease subunit [Euryarchaeota archaeon]
MTTEELHESLHHVPSDLEQIPIVWRYELLKHLRSKRLLASIALVFVVLVPINFLPPALDVPYSGTTENEAVAFLEPEDMAGIAGAGIPEFGSIALLDKSAIDLDSLEVFLGGVPFDDEDGAAWFTLRMTYQGASAYALIFTSNVTAADVTVSYEWFTAPDEFAGIFLGFGAIIVIICATFFGADALVSEFQNRTGYLIFPNPIKKPMIYIGKFAASMTASIAVLLLLYGGVAILSMFNARGIDDDLGLSFLFAVEYLVAVMAIAYLISALLKGTTGATVLTFLLFLLILPIIDGVAMFTETKVEGSLTFSGDVVSYILLDPYPVDWAYETAGFEFTFYYPDPATSALVIAAYAFIAVLLGAFLFNRKQLVG